MSLADDVVREVAGGPEARVLGRGDRAGVAEELRDKGTLGILAPRLDCDFDTRQVAAGLRDEVCRIRIDIAGDPDKVEVGARIAVDRGVDVRRRDLEERREPVLVELHETH